MTFRIFKLSRNVYDALREAGYKPLRITPAGELNCVRPLGGDYPRFHAYVKEEGEVLIFNLHLDQKKPSYKGTTAHSGDYDSNTVHDEAARIKDALFEK